MLIVDKQGGEYLVECRGTGRRHRFKVRELGYQVRCPNCGHRESAVDLATDFVFMRRAARLGGRYAGKHLEVADSAVNDDEGWTEIRSSLTARLGA